MNSLPLFWAHQRMSYLLQHVRVIFCYLKWWMSLWSSRFSAVEPWVNPTLRLAFSVCTVFPKCSQLNERFPSELHREFTNLGRYFSLPFGVVSLVALISFDVVASKGYVWVTQMSMLSRCLCTAAI